MTTESREWARSKLIGIAESMLAGTRHLVEGCQEINGFSDYFPQHAPLFAAFAAIGSETDHWPLAQARLNCAPDYLQRVDHEITEYLTNTQPEIESACRELLRALTSLRND